MLEIEEADIITRLEFDNTWWEKGASSKVSFESAPRRQYFELFKREILEVSINRALVLMGPRRVGKTVMIFQLIRDLLNSGIDGSKIFYASLETPLYTGIALERLVNLYRSLFSHEREDKLYIFFDEVQYLRDWEVHLKSLVDGSSTF